MTEWNMELPAFRLTYAVLGDLEVLEPGRRWHPQEIFPLVNEKSQSPEDLKFENIRTVLGKLASDRDPAGNSITPKIWRKKKKWYKNKHDEIGMMQYHYRLYETDDIFGEESADKKKWSQRKAEEEKHPENKREGTLKKDRIEKVSLEEYKSLEDDYKALYRFLQKHALELQELGVVKELEPLQVFDNEQPSEE